MVRNGTVKWFNAGLGYGFITDDDGGEDCFVHHNSIVMEGYRILSDCQKVTYEVEVRPDGRTSAINVCPQD